MVNPSTKSDLKISGNPGRLISILVVGDILALFMFVIVGRLSHDMTSNWLINIARIATPFLLGWFAVGVLAGAYQARLLSRPAMFLRRSALTWLLGIGLGFVFRAVLFGDGVPPIFILVILTFTGLFLLGWRSLFIWWANRSG
jgi:hypothetical protein